MKSELTESEGPDDVRRNPGLAHRDREDKVNIQEIFLVQPADMEPKNKSKSFKS